jgi:hypothetical protein
MNRIESKLFCDNDRLAVEESIALEVDWMEVFRQLSTVIILIIIFFIITIIII